LPESNPHISVFEHGDWNTIGQYSTAMEFNEDVEWIKQDTNYVLPVCLVRTFFSIVLAEIIHLIF